MEGDWCTKQVERPFGGVWKHIRRGWELFSKFIRFEVGDGTQIKFWHDVLCGDLPLKESLPVLFRIARNKEAWVSDHMQIMNEEAHWNVHFCRVAQDWEVEVVVTFYAKLYETRPYAGGGGPYFFFDKSVEFISKSANLNGAPPNYTKSITKSV